MGWADAHEVNRVRAKLALFAAGVFASVPRKDQRAKGDCYLLSRHLRLSSCQAAAASWMGKAVCSANNSRFWRQW